MKEVEHKIKNYTLELQTLYLNHMLSDPAAFVRCQNIINPLHWNDRLKPAVRYILDFAGEYNVLPTVEQLKAETGTEITLIANRQEQHTEWFLHEIENFCRHRAVELVLFDGADAIAEGKYSEIETKLKEALTISLQHDLGTSYWDDPKARIQAVLDRKDVVSTGWASLDDKLYGGFSKGTLNIFCGGSGSGKSVFLQNLALNWAFMGLNVIYISLELSENLIASRIDAMVTGYSTRDVFKKIDDVGLRVVMAGKKSGDIKIKKFPEAGTSCNDLRAYLKEYEIQEGRKPDVLVIDYLDLMYPNNKKINPSDMFIKDKFVAEEMRALYSEFNLLGASASQLNRGSVEANGDFDHSHIAGGISKINTADNVFGIFTTMAMRERGEYQLQMLKTRSSSSVGQRIDLSFDQQSLRIKDADPDESMMRRTDSSSLGKQMMSKLSGNTNTTSMAPSQPLPSSAATVQDEHEPSAEPIKASMMDILKRVRDS